MPLLARATVGKVDIVERKFFEFGYHSSTFRVELRDSDSVSDLKRLLAAKGRDSGIPRALGCAPVAVPTFGRHQLLLQLIRMRFGFLNAENVRILFFPELMETFARDRADSVDVPSYDFH